MEVYAGYAGKRLAVVTAQARSTAALHDVLLVAGMLVTMVVIYRISRIAKNVVDHAVEDLPAFNRSRKEESE